MQQAVKSRGVAADRRVRRYPGILTEKKYSDPSSISPFKKGLILIPESVVIGYGKG
jgi:hypothetical protein